MVLSIDLEVSSAAIAVLDHYILNLDSLLNFASCQLEHTTHENALVRVAEHGPGRSHEPDPRADPHGDPPEFYRGTPVVGR